MKNKTNSKLLSIIGVLLIIIVYVALVASMTGCDTAGSKAIELLQQCGNVDKEAFEACRKGDGL